MFTVQSSLVIITIQCQNTLWRPLRLGPEMVNIKVGISFKRLQFIYFHSYVSSIAQKMTF